MTTERYSTTNLLKQTTKSCWLPIFKSMVANYSLEYFEMVSIIGLLQRTKSDVVEDLKQVDDTLRVILFKINLVNDLACTFLRGGKRIRPLILLTSALATGTWGKSYFTGARSKLITPYITYDDVVDESELRRREKLRTQFGNQASVRSALSILKGISNNGRTW